jgi:CSLREA domain-containing protein
VASDAVAVWDEGRLEWQGLNFGFPGDTEVNVLHDYDGQLVAGGRFQTSGFTTVRNLGTWNGFSWEEIGSGIEGTAPEVLALTTFEGDLIVGGDFDLAGGSAVSNIARWNGSTWDDMGSELTGDVLALAVVDGILYAGGRFLRATGSPADYLARWTGSFWEAIPEPVDGSVQTLSIFENQLLVSGNFGRGGTSIVHRMGIWTGTAWETLGSGLQTPADDVAVFRGDLYVAGPFTRIGEGRTSAYLARWQDPTPDIETHVVTSLDDLNDANPGDGICADETGQCTLRAALEEANVSTGIDTVRFDLASPGPWQIIPFSNYPRLAEGVVIDATTLDGYAGAPLLELRGSSIDGSITAFAVDGRDSRIEGIAFTGWGEDALELAGTGGHRIVDCYVGVGTSGTLTDANVNGISILSPDNRIEGCTISGQGDGYGVRIVDESADRTTIVDCLIGLSPDGSTAIPNRDGILVSSGDDTRITATTISGNTDHGVQLTGGAQRTRITASTLGLDAAGGSAPNGGHGILVLDASETWIGGLLAADANQIAFNGGAGVALPFNKGPDASGTRILRNRIYGNGGLGIDLGELGVDDADPLDADTGPNDLQNAPQLEALTFHPDHTVVSGLLLGMPGERYTIEVFSSSSCDPSGSGEAERFEGRGVVTADDLGDAPFHVYLPSPLTEGEVLSATATSSAGNTSELAACLIVDAPVVEEPQVFLAQAETVPVDRYFLVGLPAYPQTGTPPVATLIGGFGDYDPDRWRVFGIVDEPEREYAENPPALRGQACFLLTTEASDLTVTGIPYRWPGAVRLVPGWNGISARPDGFEWGDCQVVLDDARAFAFGTAGADRVLASQVSWYDDVTGDLVNDGDWRTASADTTTGLWTGLPDNPFWGYVFFAREACTLVFPDAPERRSQGRPSPPPGSTLPIGASGAPRPSEAWGVSGEPGASGVSSAPASGLGLSSPLTWALTLDIEGGNGVAVGVAASDASPGWTVLRPPFVDTATTSLRLEDAPMLLADYRPAGGGPETWTVDVRSSSDTAVLTVPSRRIPSGWSAWIEDEGGHVLVDLTAHDRVEVATPPSGRRLSVIVSPVGPGVGPVRPATSGIRALRPSPVRDRAVVTVELARAGRVSLDVFDVQGRRLEPVWSGWLDAGRHDLTWRVGNGSEGREVSGVVFLRLTGPSADAARKVLVVGASD